MASIVGKIHVILSKRDNANENIQIDILFYFWFENLHKCEK